MPASPSTKAQQRDLMIEIRVLHFPAVLHNDVDPVFTSEAKLAMVGIAPHEATIR